MSLFEPQTMAGYLLSLAENYLPTSGGAFELIHPFFVACTIAASALVLASARKRGWSGYGVAAWTLGALFWPQLIVPLYLAWRVWHPRPAQPVTWRYLVPVLYLAATWGLFGGWLYREYHTVEAHLARAQQYRLVAWHEQAARELRGALARENNPHIHNLLGQELMALKLWPEALREFQTAAQAGETDPLLDFRTGEVWYQLNRFEEARAAYRKFCETSCSGPAALGERCVKATQSSR